jgi:hypothetical protein
MSVVEFFSGVCPWLLLVWVLQRLANWSHATVRGWRLLLLSGACALGVLALPIDGLRVARWMRGVDAHFSIPLTGMLAAAVYEHAFARPLFSRQDWTRAWGFGAIGGVALYPLALGLTSFDPYVWGWRFSPLFLMSGAVTGWLIWRQSRFGILLLLAAAAFQFHILESDNYWDYLLDPVYCLASFAVLGGRLAVSTRTSLTKRFS